MDLGSKAAYFTHTVTAENEKLFVEWNNLADRFSAEAYSVNWNVHWQQIYAWSQQVFQRDRVAPFLAGLEIVVLGFFDVW